MFFFTASLILTSFCLPYTLPLHSSAVKSCLFALWLLTVTLSSPLAKPAQLPYLGCKWQPRKAEWFFHFFFTGALSYSHRLSPKQTQWTAVNAQTSLRSKQPPWSHRQNSVISFLLTTENYMNYSLWFCLNLLPLLLQLSSLPVLFSLMVVIKIDKWA